MKAPRIFTTILIACFATPSLTAQIPGSDDLSFNPNDLGYGTGDGATGTVYTSLFMPDGKIIFGGSFKAVNGAITTQRFVRD